MLRLPYGTLLHFALYIITQMQEIIFWFQIHKDPSYTVEQIHK